MGETRESFTGWAILELMGHRRLGGYLSEQEIAGAAFIRIDVPEHPWQADGCTCGSTRPDSLSHEDHTHVCHAFRDGDRPLDITATQFYAAAAVYCVTPTTERLARVAATTARHEPVSEWEATWARPALAPATIEDAVEDHLDELDREQEDRDLDAEAEKDDDRIPF